jgi:hypothetical protein
LILWEGRTEEYDLEIQTSCSGYVQHNLTLSNEEEGVFTLVKHLGFLILQLWQEINIFIAFRDQRSTELKIYSD